MDNNILIPAFVFIVLVYYLLVIVFKKRSLEKTRLFSEKFKEELSNLVSINSKNNDNPGNQINLKKSIKDKITEKRKVLKDLLAYSSFIPGKLLLQSYFQLANRMSENLNTIETTIVTGGSIEAGIGENNTAFSINSRRIDLTILFITIMPLLFWSGNYTTQNVFLGYTLKHFSIVIAGFLWCCIFFWDSRSDNIIAEIRSIWKEVVIYCLMPFQDKAQQEQMILLLAKLERSSIQFDKSVRGLNDSIKKTPDQISDMVDARLTERTTITEALKSIKNANNELAVSIKNHSVVIKNIPDILSSSVSDEVKKGISPIKKSIDILKDKLTESYGNMSKSLELTTTQLVSIVRNLSDREFLEKWIDELAKSSTNISDVGQALNKYFDDAKMAGDAILDVAKCVRETQDNIGAQLHDLGRLNQLRGIDETVFRKETHDLFKNNLTKIESEHRKFREIIDDFTQTVAKDSAVRSALQEHIPNTLEHINFASESLGRLLEKVENVPEEYARIIQQIQGKAAENEKELYNIFRKGLDQFNEDQRRNQKSLTESFKETLINLNRLSGETAKNSEEQIQKQRDEFRTYIEKLSGFTKEHQNRFINNLKELDNTLKHLSDTQRENQTAYNEKTSGQIKAFQDDFLTNIKELNKNFTEQIKKQREDHNVYIKELSLLTKNNLDQFTISLENLNKILDETENRSKKWASLVEQFISNQEELNTKALQKIVADIKNGFKEVEKNLSDNWNKIGNSLVNSQTQLDSLLSKTNEDAERFSELITKADGSFQYLKKANSIAIANTVILSGFLALTIYIVFIR